MRDRDDYRRLAPYYDYLHPDGEEALARTGESLDNILKPLNVRTVLDCTCGTGLQALALARKGYDVTGSDISRPMLRKAMAKARATGLKVRWIHADVRCLQTAIENSFDAVITCGNSLLHLTTSDELGLAIRSMFDAIAPEGSLLIDLADSEGSLFNPHPFMSSKIQLPDGARLSVYTTTEHKGEITVLNVFMARDTSGGTEVTHTSMRLRIPVREELLQLLDKVGFAEVLDISSRGSITLLARKRDV